MENLKRPPGGETSAITPQRRAISLPYSATHRLTRLVYDSKKRTDGA